MPVVDMSDRLVGIVTEADFLSAIDVAGDSAVKDLFDVVIRRGRNRKTMGTRVDDLMTRDPVTAKEDDTLQSAIDRMNRNKIKRLVITDDERKVRGVVSRADLMKLYAGK